jgi:hypothetical protein
MDETKLTLDDLHGLEPLLPAEEEKKMFSLFISRSKPRTSSLINKPVTSTEKTPEERLKEIMSKLSPPEQFMLETIRDPNMPFLFNAFMYKLNFKSEVDRLKSHMESIQGMCQKLSDSPELKLILKTTLSIGNLTNYEYGGERTPSWGAKKSSAKGFRMETLMKLRDVKSADGKMTLLNYLVLLLEKSEPEVNDSSKLCLFSTQGLVGVDYSESISRSKSGSPL